MVKDIVKNMDFLKKKCNLASIKHDAGVIRDLIDTAEANAPGCIGLAANQIGSDKRIIIILEGAHWLVLVNPVIKNHSVQTHESNEGCLSLDYTTTTTRYNWVEVLYQSTHGKIEKRIFRNVKLPESDDGSQEESIRNIGTRMGDAVQHEIDHLNGIII